MRSRSLELKYPSFLDTLIGIATVPHNLINKFFEVFNAPHPRLQFTLEIGGDRLNFFGHNHQSNDNDTLKFNVFHKLTFSARNLSFLFFHLSIHFYRREVF